MKIYNFDQRSEEWLKVRLGKFTASNAQAIANNGKGLETLVFEKVAEKLTGKQKETYTNPDMDRGNELEGIARSNYEIETGTPVTVVGFCETDEFSGCSPDGFVGDDGLVEIKCKNDANYVRYLYDKKVDSEYEWQMQFQMMVCDRKWCDYVVFNPNFEKSLVIKRVPADEAMQEKLRVGLEKGENFIKQIIKKIKGSLERTKTL